MYLKIVRFYVLVLSLLEISLHSRLTAQGKSHGPIHNGLAAKGISFQEWGGASAAEQAAAAAGGALSLSPATLSFGGCALGAAHARSVTLTNRANATLHLASVAGTTPDFHASFFDAKVLPPAANTTFTVVFVPRREGPARAALYIHTSLGLHKYPVSAEGEGSEWELWPLLDVAVPLNATVEPLLHLRNPTPRPLQVTAVYSSARWLRLSLPSGDDTAPATHWRLAAGERRPLLRLRPRPPEDSRSHAAYVRIVTSPASAAPLLLLVQARAVPRGVHCAPLQLRLARHGAQEPPRQFSISLGNSAPTDVEIQASVDEPRCEPVRDPAHTDDPPDARDESGRDEIARDETERDGPPAVRVSLLTDRVAAHSQPTPAATVTVDYGALWAGAGVEVTARGVRCGGAVRLGTASVPYSVTLLPGTLHCPPLHFVLSSGAEARRERWLRVRNDFQDSVMVTGATLSEDLHRHFHITQPFAPRVLSGGGGGAALLAVQLRGEAGGGEVGGGVTHHVTLRTNVTDYTVPLLLYSGLMQFEWEWPDWDGESLRLGVVGVGAAVRVRVRVRCPAPPAAALCVREAGVTLRGGVLALDTCRPHPDTDEDGCCVAGGEALAGWLTVSAGAAGAARGAVWARAGEGARSDVTVSYHAVHGAVTAPPVLLEHCAPGVCCSAPLVLHSSMSLPPAPPAPPPLRVLGGNSSDPALTLTLLPEAQHDIPVSGVGGVVGEVRYCPAADTPPPAPRPAAAAALTGDVTLLRERLARLLATPDTKEMEMEVRTSYVVRVSVSVRARDAWPRVAAAGAGRVGAAAAGGVSELAVRLRNPAPRPLLLHAIVAHHLPLPELAGGGPPPPGVPAPHAFTITGWRPADEPTTAANTANGAADTANTAEAAGGARVNSTLLLAPGAAADLLLSFAPPDALNYTAYLYIRNNLTVLEAVPLSGRGARPSFELAGAPPAAAPLLFEVTGCSGGVVRRVLTVRNTGCVPLRVRAPRLAAGAGSGSGSTCRARGFRVSPCAGALLPPNGTRAIELAFSADWTLARARADLELRTDAGVRVLALRAAVPARLLPRCGQSVPRAPWEGAARAAGTLVALALGALLLALAALDAEAVLKRALHAMQRARAAPPRPPLDLRAVRPAPCPAAPAPPAPRRRRPHRKPAPATLADDRKEAFEEWRAALLRRAAGGVKEAGAAPAQEDDSSRSSAEEPEEAEPPPAPPSPEEDEGEGDEEDEEEEEEEDLASSGSGGSSRASPPPPRLRPAPPPRASPPRRAPPPGKPAAGAAKREKPKRKERAPPPPRAAPALPPSPPPPPPALRRAATFSEVVARSDPPPPTPPAPAPPPPAPAPAPPLGPIGSHVPRRPASPAPPAPAPAPRADDSLFYYNGEQGARWAGGGGGAGGEERGGVWAGGWGWGCVRPPPGFPAPAAPPVRAYDPFQALAAIWAPDRPAWSEPPPPPPPQEPRQDR